MVSARLCLRMALLAGLLSCSWADDCDLDVLEGKLGTLLQKVFHSQGSIPTSKSELSQRCQTDSLTDKMVDMVTPCLPPLEQGLVPITQSGIDNFVASVCSPGSFQSQYLDVAKCFNNQVSAAKKCVRNLREQYLPYLWKNKDLLFMCCPLKVSFACLQELARDACGESGENFMKASFKMVENTYGFFTMCNILNKNPFCNNWVPLPAVSPNPKPTKGSAVSVVPGTSMSSLLLLLVATFVLNNY